MSLADVIILIIVIVFLSAIVYFRWLKKSDNSTSCHCYKRQNCDLKIEDLKSIIKDEE